MTQCRHVWRPYADERRIWVACDNCGQEKDCATHAEVTARLIRYAMGGADAPRGVTP